MLPASAKVRKEKREISPFCHKSLSQSGKIGGREKISYLFLGQAIAASVLADLVTLLIPARRAVSTVVFSLTARAFPATFSLLLRWLLVGVGVLTPGEQAFILEVNITNIATMATTIIKHL